MCGTARFHGDEAGLQIGEPAEEVLTANGFADHDVFHAVDCMNLHDVLRQIHADTSNRFHDFPLPEGCVAPAMMAPIGAYAGIGEVLTNSLSEGKRDLG
jgi:hypothetical protein